jgi:hypothetical protein
MKVRSLAIKIAVVMLALMVPSLWAQDGFDGALSRAMLGTSSHLAGHPFGQPLIAADFDNDRKPDGAVLLSAGRQHRLNSFRIELHLSSGDDANLTFESSESSPGISAVDICRSRTNRSTSKSSHRDMAARQFSTFWMRREPIAPSNSLIVGNSQLI